MLMISPCKECVAPKRHFNCHATCKEYIDWCAFNNKTKETKEKFVEEENFYRAVHHRRYTKK